VGWSGEGGVTDGSTSGAIAAGHGWQARKAGWGWQGAMRDDVTEHEEDDGAGVTLMGSFKVVCIWFCI
jgi:hypothetical protein